MYLCRSEGKVPPPWAGFTLLEVMVAAAVLALGAVLIYQAFFLSLDIYTYCDDYLSLASFSDEKIWELQNELSRAGPGAGIQMPLSGTLKRAAQTFAWELSYSQAQQQNLYQVDLVITWKEGARNLKLVRDAYALYSPKI